jgi:hypothetical protein
LISGAGSETGTKGASGEEIAASLYAFILKWV